MKRTLGEYKRALQGYQPGRARGAVLAALSGASRWAAAMRGLDDAHRRSVVATLLETAWSIACIDEAPDDGERDAMRAVVAALWNTTIEPAAEERMVNAAVEAVTKQGAATRCAALGAKLKALGFGELGVHLAALVAEVSHGLDPTELDALRTLAQSAGVSEQTLHDMVRHTEEALAGGDPLARMSTFV